MPRRCDIDCSDLKTTSSINPIPNISVLAEYLCQKKVSLLKKKTFYRCVSHRVRYPFLWLQLQSEKYTMHQKKVQPAWAWLGWLMRRIHDSRCDMNTVKSICERQLSITINPIKAILWGIILESLWDPKLLTSQCCHLWTMWWKCI